jgi:putative FmdB family regulatory protein
MPIYEYRCENGHVFEVIRRMSDGPVTECEVCSAPVQQVFHPVAIHFKGKGFYNTDYGTKRKARELEKSASEGADKHDDKMASQKKEADKKAASSTESKPKAEAKPKKKD